MAHQSWRDVAFLHWPVEAATLARLLPGQLEVDTYDGMGWVTLTPFSTTCEVLGVAPLPGPRRFPETNLRTYVRAPDGTDGLWFFSLDVTNRANTILGEVLALPYSVSDMSIETGETVRYTGRRRTGAAGTAYDVAVRPHAGAADTPIDVFLTGRWSAYVVWTGLLLRCDVEHEPWPLRPATAVAVDESLLDSAGLPGVGPPTVAHFAQGVSARLSPPAPSGGLGRLLRRRTRVSRRTSPHR